MISAELQKQLIDLISKYKDGCACHGDQYGSWGPCSLCKEAYDLLEALREV